MKYRSKYREILDNFNDGGCVIYFGGTVRDRDVDRTRDVDKVSRERDKDVERSRDVDKASIERGKDVERSRDIDRL